ncbi:MAG: hypothetical protein ACR2LC_14910, partial [Pyrinomonadaceae bacterium]
MNKREGKRARVGMPTISYEDFIQSLAADSSAKLSLENSDPQFRAPEHRARIQAEHVEFLTQRISALQSLGNHYADMLENPATSAEVYNVLAQDLDELANKANLHITAPEVLRLLYPLLRLRAAEKGGC